MHVPYRLLLVDDHPIYRQTLKSILESQPDLTVSAQAANVEEALKHLGETQFALMITDLRLSLHSGHDLIQKAGELHPPVPAVMVSAGRMTGNALKSGALAFLRKDAPAEEIIQTIYDALQGRICPRIRPAEAGTQSEQTAQAIFELVCQGLSLPEIGECLLLSMPDLKKCIRDLCRQRGVATLRDLNQSVAQSKSAR